jgi:hypothetical protein
MMEGGYCEVVLHGEVVLLEEWWRFRERCCWRGMLICGNGVRTPLEHDMGCC